MSLRRILFEGDVLRLMSFTFLTKPLGFVTQILIASYFGAGAQLDAFTFARFPIVMLAQSSYRLFSAVAIPQITKSRQAMSPEQIHAYQMAMVLLFYLPVTILITLIFLFSHQVIDIIGNQLPPETKGYASDFLRVLAIPGIFYALVGMNQTLLNLNDNYRIPGIVPVLNSLISLLAIVLLHGRIGIWSMAVGFASSHLIALPLVGFNALKTGAIRFTRPKIPAGGTKLLLMLSWLVLAEQVILMANSFADKWFASGLEVGSISSINYANTLLNLGLQAFNLSLVVVMFTRLSRLYSEGDLNGYNVYFQDNLRKVCNIVVPASLGVFLANDEIVRALFQRGSFNAADTARTAGALGMYMLGLPALIVNGIVTKIFHSLQRLKEKIYLALQYIITNIIGNMLLVGSLKVTGLAISSTVAINLHLLLSLGVLYSFKSGVLIRPLLATLLRSYTFAFVTWLVMSRGGLSRLLVDLVPLTGLIGTFATATLKFGATVLVYVSLALAWRRFGAPLRRAWS